MVNVFSVDVEDYFHPAEVVGHPSAWPSFEPRVDIGVNYLLEVLAEHRVRGTFFILGWVAERQPHVVRAIAEAGHEIGCHSHLHRLIYHLTPGEFEEDTLRAVRAIADACGHVPRVYRAPSFSIVTRSLWALDVLAGCGFTHDSSIYPIVHDRYGIPGSPREAHTIRTSSGPIVEVPIATVRLGHSRVAPVGGGAYMRLFPYRYTAAGIRRMNEQENQPACIYLHPWEVDPGQPRLSRSRISGFRTYGGLNTMRSKIQRLLSDFQFSAITAVHPAAAQPDAVVIEPVAHAMHA